MKTFIQLTTMSLCLALLSGCAKDVPFHDVKFTSDLMEATTNYARVQVEMSYDGEDVVESRGIIYSKSPNLTLSQDWWNQDARFIVVNQGTSSTYFCEMFELENQRYDWTTDTFVEDLEYYYRPFAVIRGNVYYGEERLIWIAAGE